jgi:hypothetical protein
LSRRKTFATQGRYEDGSAAELMGSIRKEVGL